MRPLRANTSIAVVRSIGPDCSKDLSRGREVGARDSIAVARFAASRIKLRPSPQSKFNDATRKSMQLIEEDCLNGDFTWQGKVVQ
jgi:hypothetical protein